MKTNNNIYLSTLKRELKPVMGCTEPAAAALAGAMARELLQYTPKSVKVYASRDIIKNVMGVGIPHTNYKGLAAAVLMGVLYGEASDGLNILSKVVKGDQKELSSFIENKKIEIILTTDVPLLYIKVECECDQFSSSVTIAHEHDLVVEKIKNGLVIYRYEEEETHYSLDDSSIDTWSIDGIIKAARDCSLDDCRFIIDFAHINKKIGLVGLDNSVGLRVGSTMDIKMCNTLEEAYHLSCSIASAASDARMSGSSYPVVINSGSGNQGITTLVPPLIVGEFLKVSDEKLMKSLVLSSLIALYLAHYKGRLSALCGAFTAAIGASCAFVYLLDGTDEQIKSAINLMIANLSGIICDGAKTTCALKIYSSVNAASLSAQLALKTPHFNDRIGIIGNNTNSTLKNLMRLCCEGMEETDKTILSIMMDE